MFARNHYVALAAVAAVCGLAFLTLHRSVPASMRTPGAAVTMPHAEPDRLIAAATIAPAIAVDDEPAGSLRLEGQVIDDNEAPVAGAIVALDSSPPRHVSSDTSGAFSFEHLIPRVYVVEARARERVAGPLRVRLSDKSEPVTMRLVAGGRAEVKVVDERSGRAVEAAQVKLAGRVPITSTTDTRGLALFAGLPAGRHAVRVTAPNYAPASSEILSSGTPDTSASVTVAVRHGARVSGIVLGPTGTPAAGAIVSTDEVTEIALAAQAETTMADANGRWQLDAVPRGTFRFTAAGDAGSPATSPPTALDGVTPRTDIVLRLEVGGRIEGQVTDPGGGPVAWALVRVILPSSLLQPRVREVTTDVAGKFGFARLPIGLVDVVAQAEAASSRVISVKIKAAPTEITLVLANREAIAGVVVAPDGKPVPDAQVVAVSTTAAAGRLPETELTDQAGRFVLRGLAPGAYRVSATRRPGMWQGALRDGQETQTGVRDLQILLRDGGRVHGRVALASGGAPNRFTIMLGLSAPRAFATQDGAFELADIPPGAVRLLVGGPDFVARVVPDVVIAAGRDTDVGTLSVARGRSIAGLVLDSDGHAVAGAIVYAGHRLVGSGRSLDGAPPGLGELLQGKHTTTDDQGAFILDGIGEGSLLVAAEHASVGRSSIMPVAEGGGSSLDLVLQRIGTLSGRVTRAGAALARSVVTVTPQSSPEAILTVAAGGDGLFHFDSLAPDTYVVSAVFAEGTSVRSKSGRAVVRSGEEARVDLDLVDDGVRLLISATGVNQQSLFAQVVLSSAPLQSGTAASLQRQLTEQSDKSLHTGFIMKGQAAVISAVPPGSYTVCGVKLPGDPSDPNVAAALLDTAAKLAVECRPVTVAAAPPEQPIAIAFPVPP